jgi:hypothetical protein
MVKDTNYIEIQLIKCKVFLTPAEINQLLQKDPELFTLALRRGKGILRSRANRDRQAEGKIYKGR